MSENKNSTMYERYNVNLNKIFLGGEPLTFLVGAGVSIEAPSGLMTTRQIMESIIRFGAPEEVTQTLLEIKNLRFEYLIQEFRDTYDQSLKFLEYFEEVTQPNLIHQFLAQMIRGGQYVLTTNFDTLIERAIGLDRDELKIIITHDDFKTYDNPQQAIQENFLLVYKLHGSLRNAKTGEETRDSVIATLEALGKHKGEEIFSVEESKLDLLERVCQDRILVVIGYSGGDDFDIVPTLLRMQGLKRVIWIAHDAKMSSDLIICRISPKFELSPDMVPLMSQEDRILYNIQKVRSVEVIKVVAHTASFIADLMSLSYRKPEPTINLDAYHWLVEHLPTPTEKEKTFFAARIFYNYKLLSEALEYFQRAYEIDKQLENSLGMAKALGNIGSIHRDMGETEKALIYHQQAYTIDKKLGNQMGMAIAMDKIGIIYRKRKEYQKALEYHQRAYDINVQLSDSIGTTAALGNMGIVYRQTGDLQKALEHHQRAYEIDKNIGNLKGIAAALGNIGIIYEKMRNLEKALVCFQKSYEIDKRLGNLTGMAAASDNIAGIYERKRDRKNALKYYQEAYEIYEGLGDLLRMARQLKRIAILYRHMDEPKKALEFFQKSYLLYNGLGHRDAERITRDIKNLQKPYPRSKRKKS